MDKYFDFRCTNAYYSQFSDTFPIIVEALDNGIMKKVRLKSDESDSWQLTTTNTHIYQTFRQKQHNNNHPILEQKLQHQRKRNKRMIISKSSTLFNNFNSFILYH